MRLDLRRVCVEFHPEPRDDTLRQRFPIDVRIGGQMRVVVADGAVELARQCGGPEFFDRALEPDDDVGHFLAQRRRCRRLTVRARQHRQRSMPVCERAQIGNQGRQRGHQHTAPRPGDHQVVGEIVDVFRRAGEMDEFAGAGDLRHTGETFLQPVFDRLDVVVGRALDRLDPLSVGDAEVTSCLRNLLASRRAEWADFDDAGLVGKRLEPGQLDTDALADQRVFAEMFGKCGDLAAIPAIERRQRCKGGKRLGDRHKSDEFHWPGRAKV